MHVGTKKMAAAGLLVAFVVVMLVFSSFIESNSLFFIAAASFCVGIAIREWGQKYGLAFLVAATILSLILAPNKMYCLTFSGMGAYVWTTELLWEQIARAKKMKHRNGMLWIGKYIVFNVMYIPVLIFAPMLIINKEVTWKMAIILFLVGQALLFVYDMAYRYFQTQIWGRLRLRFLGERNF